MGTQVELDHDVLIGFVAESLEALVSLDALFIELEHEPTNLEPVHPIFRAVHSIKGNAPFFNLFHIKNLAHELESLFAKVRDGELNASPGVIDISLRGVDRLKQMLERVQAGEAEVAQTNDLDSFLVELDRAKEQSGGGTAAASASLHLALNQLEATISREQQLDFAELRQMAEKLFPQTIVTERSAQESPKVCPTTATQSEVTGTPEAAVARATQKSMRIPEERIDTFLSFVGEIIILSEMVRHFTIKLGKRNDCSDLLSELSSIQHTFTNLGTNLERAVMSIRKVPVKPALQRIPRIARDVATSSAKEVEVYLEGDDAEIDKSLLELLEAPLVHMTRNAVDHGIESPELRLQRGKERAGSLIVRCSEASGIFTLEVSDDGAGLNFEALSRKAVSLGLLDPSAELSLEQAVDLIFMAGVSTAAQVSDISGRGVGMDVVKRSIEDAGGSITVRSVAGQGSTFVLTLPTKATTQIIEGVTLAVDDAFIVLPVSSVLETWSVEPEEVRVMLDRVRVIQRHGRTMPFISMSSQLGIQSADAGPLPSLVVAVESGKGAIAVGVDRVVGISQLVVKPLTPLTNPSAIFTGCTLLGDGNIGLIVDLAVLQSEVRLSGGSFN